MPPFRLCNRTKGRTHQRGRGRGGIRLWEAVTLPVPAQELLCPCRAKTCIIGVPESIDEKRVLAQHDPSQALDLIPVNDGGPKGPLRSESVREAKVKERVSVRERSATVAPEAGQQEVIAFLADPATHGGAAVERINTHISHLFLAGDRPRV